MPKTKHEPYFSWPDTTPAEDPANVQISRTRKEVDEVAMLFPMPIRHVVDYRKDRSRKK